MVIDGKEIVFFQKKNDVSERYYEILKQEVKNAIKDISSVEQVKVVVSKKTDSFYFYVSMYRLDEPLVVSIRTHGVKEKKENHIYIYIPRSETMRELNEYVQKKVLAYYNLIAVKRGFKQAVIEKKELNNNPSKKKLAKRKLRGTKTELLSVQEDSFDLLLKEFKDK